MTSTTVPIVITCPDWCESTPEQHAAQLWENGGDCFHYLTRVVEDPTGIQRPLEQTKVCEPIEVRLITAAAPDGHESESPIFYLEQQGGSEHSVDQLLAVADAVRDMVAQYRAAGGVA